MLPGMGGLEIVVVALIALIVIGPKDLPVFLRKLGRFTGKVRGMAQEFRNSFDELARQSELDELRREVEALRTQSMRPLGPELNEHFADINQSLADHPAPTVEPVAASAFAVDGGTTQTAPVTAGTKSKAASTRRKPAISKVAGPKPPAARTSRSRKASAPKTGGEPS